MSERSYSFEPAATQYQIGTGVILNTHANTLLVGRQTIELENRLVLLLVYLIHHQGEVLSKDLLLKTIWQGKVVNDDSLSVAVSHIRKALGDNSRAPQFIKTIPGVGYQFIASAEPVTEKSEVVVAAVESAKSATKSLRFFGLWGSGILLGFCVLVIGYYLSQPTKATATSASHFNAATNQQLHEAGQLLAGSDAENWRAAIKIYRDLINREGEIAEAFLGIADAKMKLLGEQLVVKENCVEVVSLLQRAVALNPSLAAAHRSLANASFWCQRDYAGAEQHYLAAIKQNPADDEAAIYYAELLLAEQRFKESLEQVDRARRLNPLNYSVPVVVWIYQMQERDDLALRELQRILTTEPDNRYFHISALRIFKRMGDAQKAFEELKWLMGNSGFTPEAIADAKNVFTQTGLAGINNWLLERKETADLGDYTPPLSWARYALGAKHYDLALDYLEQAYERRQYPVLWANVDPAYDPVRNTPQFQKIIEQLKQPDNK